MNFYFPCTRRCRKGSLQRRAQVWCANLRLLSVQEILSWVNYLLLGKGEDATGGRKRESVTSDAMEALIGAIYLDGGFANAKEFIQQIYFK